MTIILTLKESQELWDESIQNSRHNFPSQELDFYSQLPRQLGKGQIQGIELHPNFRLAIIDYEYDDHIVTKFPTWDHPLQFAVYLSGKAVDENGGKVGEGYTLISGSGVQRKMTIQESERLIGVNIEMAPELLRNFFPTEDGNMPLELDFLVKGDDWQTLLYPRTTPAIQGVAQQIINCPYQGIIKRIYLQGKVMELIGLQLAPILIEQSGLQPSPRLQANTISRIHHAREILLFCLENPPSLLKLAQQVGVSDRTLRRGFKELFGTTVFGYLTDKRMEKAEQWLRGNTYNGQCQYTVAEVANLVGYSNPAHFAATFKRKFGITPSQCLLGKKSVLR
ncbi:AraC family transcriptional regulator [Nostoc sp.]|uniref:AraC family transcriptional regulator n=1 Tax=Nostoc sp. TaxID=1180 RepID=UPI002FFA7F92